ncbi:hypothetical protein M514_01208 [Trichuris suis]|uniref:Tetraspanin family protein n=1 Tax=Trichuris suis TaxID=68888 RepID=A0A085NMZ5_9BILA|nr:hypothetical protein M514_01208 [Trichuris suis]
MDNKSLNQGRRMEEITEGSIMMNEKKVELLYPQYMKFRKIIMWTNCVSFFISASLFIRTGIALSEKQDFFKMMEMYTGFRMWRHLLPPVNEALSFIYTMAIIWFTAVLICFSGLDGALFTELSSLERYLCLTSTIFFIFGFDILASTLHSGMGLRKARAMLFQAYAEQHYAVSSFSWIFTSVIDNLQASCHCCGYTIGKSVIIKYRAQHAVVFWSETTNWGLKQASDIQFNDSALVELVPRSCCRTPDDEKCNIGKYYDRVNWSIAMDDIWSDRIYVKSCNKCTDYYNIFFAPGCYFSFLVIILITVLISVLCFLSLYMLKCIEGTPNLDVVD